MGSRTTRFCIGTSGWTYPSWKGHFYPEDLPQRRWFEYYTVQFPAVEVNATFYRRFKDTTYLNWRERAPEGFRYVLKAPRPITHRKYLAGVEEDVAEFWRSASLLEDRLGLILLQLAPRTPYDPACLKGALLAFADPKKVAVEFRHDRWLTEETRNILEETGSVFCTADSPKNRLMDWLTSDAGYIRLHGRKKWYSYDYSREELREIAALARILAKRGAQTVYIFFNNDAGGYAPKNALALKQMLRA